MPATYCDWRQVLRRRCPLAGSTGFSLPDIVNSADPSTLGIHVENPDGNQVLVSSDLARCDLRIKFRASRDCTVIIGAGDGVAGAIEISGSGVLVVISGCKALGANKTNLRVNMQGQESTIFFGRDLSSVGSQWLVEGKGKCVVVGDDLLSSWDVWVRNHDSHGIVDLDTGKVLNEPKDIVIGPHCWLGQRSMVLKASVGGGSVVGAGAIVTTSAPAKCALAGVPARIVRENIGWTRSTFANDATRASVLDVLRNLGIE